MKWIVIILSLLSPSAFAYYSVWDTGEVLKEGHYETSLEGQFITAEGSGMNVTGRFDFPIQDDSSGRVMLGAGAIDFHAGAFYKFIPYPDTEKQPAIGAIFGAIYARNEGENFLTLRIAPLVSKVFQLNFGEMVPYASLPIGLTSRKGGTDVPINFAIGTDVKTDHFKHWRWRTEVGFNIDDSYSYVSIGAILDFDQENGIMFE